MIKLNYTLIRDENDESKSYTPNEHLREFHDLTYIKGPNGSGKSAILHIIALAFYGNYLPKEELDPGLKRKIENLLDLNHNQLTFDLEISNPILGLTLKSQKRNPETKDIEVSVIRNGRKIFYPQEKFTREFRLLYTIPNDPTTQLPQLLREISASQTDVANRITRFRDFLQRKISRLEKSRDEVSFSNAKKAFDETQEKVTSIDEKLSTQKAEYEKLLKYFYVKVYLDSLKEMRSIENKINIIDNEIRAFGEITDRRIRNQRVEERQFEQTMVTIEREKNRLMEVLARHAFNDDLWMRYNQISSSRVTVEINKPDIQKTIRENLKVFINLIDNLVESEQIAHSTELKSFDLYQSLLGVLKRPEYINLSVPGTEGNVKLLINHIETAIFAISKIRSKIESFDSASDEIKRFLKKLEGAISYRQKNPISPEDIETDNENRVRSSNQEKGQLESQKIKFREKRENARKKLIELKEDPNNAIHLELALTADSFIKNYKDTPEEKIREYLVKEELEIKNGEDRLTEAKRLLQHKKKILFDLQNQEIDPNREYLPQLKRLASKIQPLENKFRNQFETSLQQIRDNKKVSNLSQFDKEYSDQIGKYYAKKMQKILYADAEYEVLSVDVVEQIITTTTGKKIKFDELGTGQSQSSYLKTKLAMTDERITIALFDELAMMDQKSLEPVVNLLKTDYEQGKLLCSIVVRPDENFQLERL